MKRRLSVWRVARTLFAISAVAVMAWPSAGHAASPTDRLAGYILLQVERNGEAWYVHPETQTRYFLNRPDDAFSIMRQQGLGISNANLEKIPIAGSSATGDLALRQRLSGRILLQVERNGEAWYVYPGDLKRYSLGRPYDAWQIMTRLGLGVSNNDLYLLTYERNLDLPFTAQAPYGVWDFDHDNFCEEASALMVGRYFQGKTIDGAADAEQALQSLKDWEVSTFGYHKDTSANDTARMIREYFGLTVEIVDNPTLTRIREALDAGKPVIAPVDGQRLNNPHFRDGGPPYHMFVIKGYTNDGYFITHEPGTRYGKNYRYHESIIRDALHDFNGGDVDHGIPRILIVSQP